MLYNTRTYNQNRVEPDRVEYAGPANTFTVKDVLSLFRTMPKPVNGFLGVARPGMKFVKTVTTNATTGETHDLIFNVTASVPVGTPSADVDAVCADLAAFVNTADAKALFKSGKVNI